MDKAERIIYTKFLKGINPSIWNEMSPHELVNLYEETLKLGENTPKTKVECDHLLRGFCGNPNSNHTKCPYEINKDYIICQNFKK